MVQKTTFNEQHYIQPNFSQRTFGGFRGNRGGRGRGRRGRISAIQPK